jgi:hypothetical protein
LPWEVEQRLNDPPALLDHVLAGEVTGVADQGGVEQHLVGGGSLAALLGELHLEVDLGGAAAVGSLGVEHHADPRVGVDTEDQLAGLRAAARLADEGQARCVAKDEPQLGLARWHPLAGADEEGHPGPSPAVDLQAQCDIGLGVGVPAHAVDLAVALVLPAHGALGVHGDNGAQHRRLGVLEAVGIARRGRVHGGGGHHLHQVVDDHVAQRPHRVIEMPTVLDSDALGHRDLHGGDVAAVPHRLEDRVGEAQIQDLVEPHLAEEVVDAI